METPNSSLPLEFDELELMLRQITKEIKDKEEVARRLNNEIEELKSRARSLDLVRSMFLAKRSAAMAYAVNLQPRQAVSLQEEILKCLEDGREASMPAIVSMLKARNYPSAQAKHFYVNVATTVKRLVGKGKIAEAVGFVGNRKVYKLVKPAPNLDPNENTGVV